MASVLRRLCSPGCLTGDNHGAQQAGLARGLGASVATTLGGAKVVTAPTHHSGLRGPSAMVYTQTETASGTQGVASHSHPPAASHGAASSAATTPMMMMPDECGAAHSLYPSSCHHAHTINPSTSSTTTPCDAPCLVDKPSRHEACEDDEAQDAVFPTSGILHTQMSRLSATPEDDGEGESSSSSSLCGNILDIVPPSSNARNAQPGPSPSSRLRHCASGPLSIASSSRAGYAQQQPGNLLTAISPTANSSSAATPSSQLAFERAPATTPPLASPRTGGVGRSPLAPTGPLAASRSTRHLAASLALQEAASRASGYLRSASGNLATRTAPTTPPAGSSSPSGLVRARSAFLGPWKAFTRPTSCNALPAAAAPSVAGGSASGVRLAIEGSFQRLSAAGGSPFHRTSSAGAGGSSRRASAGGGPADGSPLPAAPTSQTTHSGPLLRVQLALPQGPNALLSGAGAGGRGSVRGGCSGMRRNASADVLWRLAADERPHVAGADNGIDVACILQHDLHVVDSSARRSAACDPAAAPPPDLRMWKKHPRGGSLLRPADVALRSYDSASSAAAPWPQAAAGLSGSNGGGPGSSSGAALNSPARRNNPLLSGLLSSNVPPAVAVARMSASGGCVPHSPTASSACPLSRALMAAVQADVGGAARQPGLGLRRSATALM